MSRPLPFRLFPAMLSLGVAFASHAAAATRAWPALVGPGCNGTLQQCIQAADAGDTVRIVADDLLLPDAYTTIDEHLLIDKSLTLEAAPGIDAVFAPGRTVLVNSPTSGAVSVTLRRLVMRAGTLRVVHRNADAGSYTLDQLRIDEAAGGIGDCAVEFEDYGAGAPSFVMGDSTLRFHHRRQSTPSGICAYGVGGPWQVAFFRNYIESSAGALFTGITVTGESAGNVAVSGNHLYTQGAPRGLSVSQNTGSAPNVLSIHDNLISGQYSVPPVYEVALFVNPSNTDMRIVNNTVARNSNGIQVAYTDGNASFGTVANNIIAYSNYGLTIDSRYTTVANRHNLVFGNQNDTFVPGAGTITLDPQFVDMYDFRLRPASPARDAGNNADVPTLFGVAFDADGERRIADAAVDIGAFEWSGDQSVRHLAGVDNTVVNTTRLDGLQAVGPFENVLLTPLRGPVSGSELEETLGVYQTASGGTDAYRAFHEDSTVDLSPGRRIHAFVPDRGVTGFLHTSTLASVVDAYSRISHPELDSRPSAIAFVTHNWNPGGPGGTYHDHRLGLDYVAPNWFVGNQDAASMQSARAFNIVVAPIGSPNAFVQPVGPSARAELRLTHPLLDDNECATLQVGRAGSTLNDTAFSLDYRAGGSGAPGHWFIVAEGAGTPSFPANSAFNVMVPGTQSNGCRVTRLFSDGFE
jgi:hypothetical protein